MRSIAMLTILGMLLCAAIVQAQESKVDFSGEWTLNADKSDMGGPGGGRSGGRGGDRAAGRGGFGGGTMKMIVTQKEDVLSVETFRLNRDGEETSTVTVYNLNGEKTTSSTERSTTTSTAKWSEDGTTIIITSSREMSRGDQSFTMETVEKWKLDNGTLVIESTRNTQRGDSTTKRVYDKKK